jgi:hypothetical protein
MAKQKYITVVVLNDGSTFSDISGCTIQIIPAEQEELDDARDFTPISTTLLNEVTR